MTVVCNITLYMFVRYLKSNKDSLEW